MTDMQATAGYGTAVKRFANSDKMEYYAYIDPAGNPCVRTWLAFDIDRSLADDIDTGRMSLGDGGLQAALSVYHDNTFSAYLFGYDGGGDRIAMTVPLMSGAGSAMLSILREAYPDADAFARHIVGEGGSMPDDAAAVMSRHAGDIVLKNAWNEDGDGYTSMNGTKYDVAWHADGIPAYFEDIMAGDTAFDLDPYNGPERIEAYACFAFSGRADMYRQSEEYGKGFALHANVDPDNIYFRTFSGMDGRFKAFSGRCYVIRALESKLGPVFGSDPEPKPMRRSNYQRMMDLQRHS